jgi:hypothetical protein
MLWTFFGFGFGGLITAFVRGHTAAEEARRHGHPTALYWRPLQFALATWLAIAVVVVCGLSYINAHPAPGYTAAAPTRQAPPANQPGTQAPAGTASPIATGPPELPDALVGFEQLVAPTGWQGDTLGETYDVILGNATKWWQEACTHHDLRYLYGFAQPRSAFVRNHPDVGTGKCGTLHSEVKLRNEELTPERLYSVVGIDTFGAVTTQWVFITAGSAQCPACQYNHWVMR